MSARLLNGKLPDFIIAGIYKSGTTSLFVNLSKHPRIEMTPNASKHIISGKMQNVKEVHFFNERWANGVSWYQSLFNNNNKLQGEAASKYLFDREFIKRMSSVVPKAKIIVSLRNPVDRAYSQYGFSKEPFPNLLSVVQARLERNKSKYKEILELRNMGFDEIIKKEIQRGIEAGRDIAGKGFYVDMLEQLFKYYPREQVMIIISERMKQDMPGTYNRIFDFLGVPRAKIDFDMNVNVSEHVKPMSKRTRKALKKIYDSYNKRLFDLLGYEVPEWYADE